MNSYYSVGEGMSVAAIEPGQGIAGEDAVLNGDCFVEVVFPNRNLLPVTVYRIYPSFSAAKAEAEAVARQLNVIARSGFPRGRGTIREVNEDSRREVESFVRDWAGVDGTVIEV